MALPAPISPKREGAHSTRIRGRHPWLISRIRTCNQPTPTLLNLADQIMFQPGENVNQERKRKKKENLFPSANPKKSPFQNLHNNVYCGFSEVISRDLNLFSLNLPTSPWESSPNWPYSPSLLLKKFPVSK